MVPLQLMSISGKELHVSVLPLHVPERPFLGRGHPNGLGRGLRSLGAEPSEGQAREGAARAREPVLGRPLRPAPSSEAWPCFCSRVADLFASGLVRASGVRPAWARWQEPAQAPAQQALQALQPRDQALKPRGGPHCQPFLLRVILLVVVQENRKGNAGPAGIYDVAVYICQFEAQGAQGNGAVQFHEMALVGSVCIMLPTPLSIIILQMIS